MQKRINPPRDTWCELCTRPSLGRSELDEVIGEVYRLVEQGGDNALLALTERYDAVLLDDISLRLDAAKTEGNKIDVELRQAIDLAYDNIAKFHRSQMLASPLPIETTSGVKCWRETRPILSVGLYVPGGTAPLISTMLMLGIPAMLAGCKNIVVCTPPNKKGTVEPALRYAAAKCGINTIYTVGGAQAVAAMVLGTESISPVSKVFGPGNQYVTAAKAAATAYGVAIDMPAGPSEVLVIADETADPRFVAADLLSQAEHGVDSQVVLISTSRQLSRAVRTELDKQLSELPRRDIAKKSLEKSLDIYFDSLDEAFAFANEYAPEHIIVQVENSEQWAKLVVNAGSVFVGAYTPESAGDYASGTNHTLPTAGWAKSYSGLSVDDFQRKLTYQTISQDGLNKLASAIIPIAEAEGLTAHARAVTIRTLNS